MQKIMIIDRLATNHVAVPISTHALFVDGSELFSNGLDFILNEPEVGREIHADSQYSNTPTSSNYCVWNGTDWELCQDETAPLEEDTPLE